jgi:peptidoglycan hydrolase CwlO-like protein
MSIDEFYVDEIATIRALGLVAAMADPVALKTRMESLAEATSRFVAQREAAEAAITDAEPTRAAVERATAELNDRTNAFQTWTNSQEARFRKREADVRTLEELLAKRQAELVENEADLAKRVRAHDDAVDQLKARLAS